MGRRGSRRLVVGCLSSQEYVGAFLHDIIKQSPDLFRSVTVADGRFGNDAALEGCSHLVVREESGHSVALEPLVVFCMLRGVPVVSEEWIAGFISSGERFSGDFETVEKYLVFSKEITQNAREVGRQLLVGERVAAVGDWKAKDKAVIRALVKAANGQYTLKPDLATLSVVSDREVANHSKSKTNCMTMEEFLQFLSGSQTKSDFLLEKSRRKCCSQKSIKDLNKENAAPVSRIGAQKQKRKRKEDESKVKKGSKAVKALGDDSEEAIRTANSLIGLANGRTQPEILPEKKKPKRSINKAKLSELSKREVSSLKRKSSGCNKFAVAFSGFKENEQSLLIQILKHIEDSAKKPKSNLRIILGGTGLNATHIVVPEQNAKRTIKVLNGIAGGAWIVKSSWVLESLDYKYLVEELPHLADDHFPGAAGFRSVENADLRVASSRTRNNPSLVGLKVFCEKNVKPSINAVKKLVKRCGGNNCNDETKSDLILTSSKDKDLPLSHKGRKPRYHTTEWLFDNIAKGNFELSDREADEQKKTKKVRSSRTDKCKKVFRIKSTATESKLPVDWDFDEDDENDEQLDGSSPVF